MVAKLKKKKKKKPLKKGTSVGFRKYEFHFHVSLSLLDEGSCKNGFSLPCLSFLHHIEQITNNFCPTIATGFRIK